MPENTQIALLTSKSLPELICSELEGWIAQGKVSPGQPLREADISAQMGLSRGPVRAVSYYTSPSPRDVEESRMPSSA